MIGSPVPLRRQLHLARLASLLAFTVSFAGAILAAGALRTSPFYFVPPVALVVWGTGRYLPLLVVKRAYRRLSAAVEREDYADARGLLLELRAIYRGSRSATEWLQLQEGTVLSMQGKYAEAAALLQSIDRGRLGAMWAPLLLNNLAWALALAGKPDAGVARARESIEAWDKAANRAITSNDLRACQLGTLGAALVLSGEAAEGVSLLEQSLARGGRAREQAARAFFLGEGLRALGREEDAATAYRRAAAEAPESEFGRRGRSALEELRPYRA
jgi:tetratricopeptide (TPR) repeat protein